MYCPHCGQQQISDTLRFCSRCGFPLEGVIYLLDHGGMLPYQPADTDTKEMSPKRRGVRQGAILFLAGMVLVPLLGMLNSFTSGFTLLDILVPMAAIIFFLGGLMRMLFAAIFEEGAKPPAHIIPPYGAPIPARLSTPPQSALPPAHVNPAGSWRPRPETGEIRQPSSVTENTTRLLDKDDRQNR